ncbi:MAG: cation-translocating P-type ATPase [Bacteroidota bacterium]
MDEKTLLHVEGMTCANCANTITRTLQKEGLKEVNVNYLTTEITFEEIDPDRLEKIKSRIKNIGYKVVEEKNIAHEGTTGQHDHHGHSHSSGVEKKFFLSALFTAPLLLHMILPFAFLHNPYVQLSLCIPVMIIGINYFGRSAWGSVKAGAMNMDVLIFIGSISAFIYSLAGMWMYSGTPQVHDYLFFETAASIISFVLLGNVLEQRSVKQTTSAILELSKLQPQVAKKITTDSNGVEKIIEIKSGEIINGDLLFIATGDKIPADGAIVHGSATVNESMITGESLPVLKTINEKVTGGTIIEDGSVKMIAEATGSETTLAKIIRMVNDAQLSKPNIQRLGDRVSNIFVPAVLLIAVLTFLVTYFMIDAGLPVSMMRSIAVLVISCPCAMGLATPTALMVGIGRAARNGILIKGGSTVEQFSKVKTIVFDKTGTLTTGNFKIKKIETIGVTEEEVKILLYAIEQHSSHPIAKSIVKACESYLQQAAKFKWNNIAEDKGIGMNATDQDGNLYSAGSYSIAKHCTGDDSHAVYLLKNNLLIATIDIEDEIKPGAKETISKLKSMGIKTVMLSGDRKKICEEIASELIMDEVYSEQLPRQKLILIEKFSKEQMTAMVGDGINDAPALAKADVGISLSGASQVAIQSAQIILLKSHDLRSLLLSYRFSRHTLLTIKQNLFWAFAYNVIAIPVAAAGFLSPGVGALSMALSDVVLISNSIRLRFKKID